MTATFAPLPEWSGCGVEHWDGITNPDDQRFISASSIPKVLASPGLERWALNTTIQMLHERLPEFQAIAARNIDEAIRWAGQLRFEPKPDAELNAADSGTIMHELLEDWLRGRSTTPATIAIVNRDPVLTAMAGNLWAWFNRFKPEPVAMEQVVYDPDNGVAGRLDAIVRFATMPEHGTCLVDLKNSRDARTGSGAKKRPYGDSHALQLATYRYAPLTATFEPRIERTKRATSTRTYLLNPAEAAACVPSVQIDSTFILQNNPETCLLYPIETGPAVRRRLVEAIGLWRWAKQESQGVVGDPVAPPIAVPTLT